MVLLLGAEVVETRSSSNSISSNSSSDDLTINPDVKLNINPNINSNVNPNISITSQSDSRLLRVFDVLRLFADAAALQAGEFNDLEMRQRCAKPFHGFS